MTRTGINASAATLTKNRTEDSVSELSGMCVTCIDGCVGMCEIGKSAYRGYEVIYPQPFGLITTASGKEYPLNLSHFSIMGTIVGAIGIEDNPDKAIFQNVNIENKIGREKDITVGKPFIIPGLGSTAIAKNNWEGLAVGAALSGVPLTIGENVCGMDEESIIEDGKIIKSKDLEWRIKLYKKWQRNDKGAIIVQANVEDTRLGVHEYAIEKLDVDAVELKWGQGAKDIGGEVKIKDLKKAQLLKKRGYIVIPDPESKVVIEAFEKGSFKEFERHSRVGMIKEKAFVDRIKELRDLGAKHVFLKTGAYRPVDLARAIKFASLAEIDLLTIDAAGGGTGMSPWRMMNEWGVPPVELYSLVYKYINKLKSKRMYVPDIALASGITFEDQIFKVLALCAPYVKLVGMARGPLAAAMVGKTIGKRIKDNNIPVYVERFGNSIEDIFVTSPQLKKELGEEKFKTIPAGGLGLYTYYERLSQGLRQFMCGARKFSLEHISRNDIAALTKESAEVSGIKYIMDIDKEEAEKVLL